MAAASGIGISPELTQAFANAVESNEVRFLKVAIQNERLVPDGTIAPSGSALEDDIGTLQTLLEDSIPAYVLARLGGAGSSWLAISYVPDNAKVRDKMLYASTRNALTKGLGSTQFVDTLFATSKADLTPEAYAAHKAHNAAPKPLSAREKELVDIREAEREAGNTSYEGTSARRSHVGKVGLNWSEEASAAVKELGQGDDDHLLLMSIDTATETLSVTSSATLPVSKLSTTLPASEASYSFYAWNHNHTGSPRREIIFIYSCPSSSPIKDRMLYSCCVVSSIMQAKELLEGSSSVFASRKIQTSDPSEVDEEYLVSELGLKVDLASNTTSGGGVASETKLGGKLGADEGRSFARPKGPGRKR